MKNLILCVLFSITSLLAQPKTTKNIIGEYDAKNIKRIYQNSSTLMIVKDHRNLVLYKPNNKEKYLSINLEVPYQNISVGANDSYLLMTQLGESNSEGVFIDSTGKINKIPFRTSYAKISKNGKFLMTTQTNFFGDGIFQIIDTRNFEKLELPSKLYSSEFAACFLSDDRVFIITQNIHIVRDKKTKKKKSVNRTTYYHIYNIISNQIELSKELKINNVSYRINTEKAILSVATDGLKVVIACSVKDRENRFDNNILLFDVTTLELIDLTKTLELVNATVNSIDYISNEEFFLHVFNRDGQFIKYFDGKNQITQKVSKYYFFEKVNNKIYAKSGKVKFYWSPRTKEFKQIDSEYLLVKENNGENELVLRWEDKK